MRWRRGADGDDKMNLKRSLRRLLNRNAFAHLYDDAYCRSSLRRLEAQCAGQSVALVGNAQSLLEQAQGPAIDGHDVVIRLNRGLIRNPEAQGCRTDMLGLACDMSMSEIRHAFGNPTLAWLTPIRELITNDVLATRDSMAFAPVDFWRDLSRQVGDARPSAGLIMLATLREFGGCTSIDLYGFDFKHSKTFYHSDERHGREGVKRPWHDWSAEESLVQRWVREDKSLKVH